MKGFPNERMQAFRQALADAAREHRRDVMAEFELLKCYPDLARLWRRRGWGNFVLGIAVGVIVAFVLLWALGSLR